MSVHRWNKYNFTTVLPIEYTPVEYLESSGTQYIDTGFIPDQDTRVVADVQFMSAPTAHATICGVYDATNSWWVYYRYGDNQYRAVSGGKTQTAIDYADPTIRTTLEMEKGSFSVGDNTVTMTENTFSMAASAFLFEINGANSYPAACKMFSCQFYDGDTLVRDFVPCTDANGAAGMYDMVNGVFYGNAGSGAFAVGKELNNIIVGTFVERVESTDRNAYPLSGIQDGYYYKKIILCGQPITLGGGGASNTLPEFTYTGDSAIKKTSDYGLSGDYDVLALTSSGMLTFSRAVNVDIFMVGAGGGGGSSSLGSVYVQGGAGGGGGYTKTETVKFKSAECVVGAGGSMNVDGGTTSVTVDGTSYTALGGKTADGLNGGAGGSGGAGGASSVNSVASGAGGTGGEDGSNGTKSTGYSYTGGTGQGSTTRAFGERNAVLFSGGGGAGACNTSTPNGGNGGGGRGAYYSTSGANGVAGTTNTGGGGGGNYAWANKVGKGGTGGSGIILIRPHQES